MFPAAPRSLGAEDGTYTGSLVSGMPDGEGVSRSPGRFVHRRIFRRHGGTQARQPICRGHCCTAAAAFSDLHLPLERRLPEGEGALRWRERRRAAVHLARRWERRETAGPGVFDLTSTASSPSRPRNGRKLRRRRLATVCRTAKAFSPARVRPAFRSPIRANGRRGSWTARGTLSYDAENLTRVPARSPPGALRRTGLRRSSLSATCEPEFTLTENQLTFLRETADLWERANPSGFFSTPLMRRCGKNVSIAQCFSDDSFREEPYWMEIYAMRIITARTGALVPRRQGA